MADKKSHGVEKQGYVDPGWYERADGSHAVTEIVSYIPGASSPYGSTVFPLEDRDLLYVHPTTRINR